MRKCKHDIARGMKGRSVATWAMTLKYMFLYILKWKLKARTLQLKTLCDGLEICSEILPCFTVSTFQPFHRPHKMVMMPAVTIILYFRKAFAATTWALQLQSTVQNWAWHDLVLKPVYCASLVFVFVSIFNFIETLEVDVQSDTFSYFHLDYFKIFMFIKK